MAGFFSKDVLMTHVRMKAVLFSMLALIFAGVNAFFALKLRRELGINIPMINIGFFLLFSGLATFYWFAHFHDKEPQTSPKDATQTPGTE